MAPKKWAHEHSMVAGFAYHVVPNQSDGSCMALIRILVKFVLAVALAYVAASVASSLSVLGHLEAMGVAVSTSESLAVLGRDIAGMTTSMLPLVAAAFAIALPVATGIAKLTPRLRTGLMVAAGFVGLVALHLILRATFDITPLAGARTTGGLLSQGLAGAAGAWLFARLPTAEAHRTPA